MMRTLAIGDIHGCLTALTTLLDFVAHRGRRSHHRARRLRRSRSRSRGVLDLLIALHAGGRLIALRGNHDEMMCEARIGSVADRGLWLACGGRETLRSYGAGSGESDLKEIPEATGLFWNATAWTGTRRKTTSSSTPTPTRICPGRSAALHAAVGKTVCAVRHISGKAMICGHTRQLGGVPRNGRHRMYRHGRYEPHGWLTCLDVDERPILAGGPEGQRRDGMPGRAIRDGFLSRAIGLCGQ